MRALLHADQSEPASPLGRLRVETSTIIGDRQHNGALAQSERDRDAGCTRMFIDILQTLLGDAIYARGNFAGHRDGESYIGGFKQNIFGPARKTLAQVPQGSCQTQIIENGRMQLVRKIASACRGLNRSRLQRSYAALPARQQRVIRKYTEVHCQGSKVLACSIV